MNKQSANIVTMNKMLQDHNVALFTGACNDCLIKADCNYHAPFNGICNDVLGDRAVFRLQNSFSDAHKNDIFKIIESALLVVAAHE